MAKSPLNILILDDNPKDYNPFWRRYGEVHKITLQNNPDEGILKAKDRKWDTILVDLDYGQGYEQGLTDVLPAVLKNTKKRCPVLVVTSDTRKETQQMALQKGANGIVLKAEWNEESLLEQIEAAIKRHGDYDDSGKKNTGGVKNLKAQLNTTEIILDADQVLIFASPAMQELKSQLETAVNYPHAPVLILGENGVGKEIAARFLHLAKGNKETPLEIINLSALNKDLIASELFGHAKGSFTGAATDKEGYFERVKDGVLFLDEIGEISHEIQVQLLRALENRTYQRVGDTKLRKLEAHLVFATNKDLEEAVASGAMREDFFQRINSLVFTIPPLRERTDDILPIAAHFFQKNLHGKHPLYGKTIENAFSKEAWDKFLHYNWPGNIRELRNIIQRLLFDADMKKKQSIDLELLPDRLKNSRPKLNAESDTNQQNMLEVDSPNDWGTDKLNAYADMKRIEDVLIKEGGRKLEAAQRLGLKNDQTLRYRIQKKYFEKYPELFEEFPTIKKVYKI